MKKTSHNKLTGTAKKTQTQKFIHLKHIQLQLQYSF